MTMNLIKFIDYLNDDNKLKKFISENYPGIDYYDAEVYLKDSIDEASDLILFDSEKIDGNIKMKIDDEKFINLFSLDLLIEVYNDYFDSSSTDLQIAKRIIRYRINDA